MPRRCWRASQRPERDGRRRPGHLRRHRRQAAARKIRRLYNDRMLAGFAGSAADSFALFSRFETKLEQYRGNLERSAVELAKDWRTDRMLRRLEAMLIVMDPHATFLLSGTGDLIEPDDGIVAIGSGGAVRARRGEGAGAAHRRSTRAHDRRAGDGRSPPRSASTRTRHDRPSKSSRSDPWPSISRKRPASATESLTPRADRRRARQVRRRPATGEARGGDRAAQPDAPAEAARPSSPRKSRRRTS